jgi:hypothetical protein
MELTFKAPALRPGLVYRRTSMLRTVHEMRATSRYREPVSREDRRPLETGLASHSGAGAVDERTWLG